MILLKWYREWKEIKNQFPKEEKICESCETLKMQLSIANQEKATLLNRLLEKPVELPKEDTSTLKPILPNRQLSWRVRQQMLEREDRAQARILEERRRNEVSTQGNSPKSVVSPIDEFNKETTPATSVEDLEREMDMVSEERESQSGTVGVRNK